VIETQALIPGYCTTHQCTEVEAQLPLQTPRTPPCRDTSRLDLSFAMSSTSGSVLIPATHGPPQH
jgi:hypothetical protein